MKLLIITQKVDRTDSVLGFFHRWIEEFAKHCEELNVICLCKGEFNLPNNVKVWSLGKEENVSKIKYLYRFYSLVWRLRKNYDSVFVHMNHQYVVLGGLIWRLWKKRIGLWYVHRQYGFLLRVAEKIAHYIFTTSNEGFQIKSQKVIMTGHGIPVDMFARAIHTLNSFSNLDTLKLAMVGRITPIKDVMTFLKALVILKQVDVPVKVEIIGSPVLASDFVYFEELKKYISRNNLRDCIEWRNGFTYDQIPFQLVQCHIVVNLSPTGGVDKVVLESMAAGRVVVVLNKAFENYFGSLKEKFLLINGSAEEVAKKINSLWIDKALLAEYGKYLQGKVRETSDLCVLVTKICSYLT